MGIIEGVIGAPLVASGAPVNGTDEVQTITLGGTPTGGTFKLAFMGFVTAAIAWSATNNTLRDNVDAALEALPTIGTGGVATAVGTMTAGIGTLTVTFSGANLAKRAVPNITVADNSLTGTAPTVAVAETTPGVDATGRGTPLGQEYVDSSNGKRYTQTGTALAPVWALIGTQS
jgi:cell division septation protein DedD